VAEIDDRIRALAGGSRSGLGVGGMLTKIQAAELATRSGCMTIVAHGGRPDIIVDAANLKPVGTRFLPAVNHIESRKRWILSERTSGAFVADDGAVRALRSGKSLLPVGVRQVIGEFERGEFVAVHDLNGREVARGITRYSARDAARIAGRRSDQIEKVLGYSYAPLLIHADDLVVL
jgi:glutamate 5-kinase (EC 2.7.2.11)